MINRILIRIKVLQVVYAYYQKESKDLRSAEAELMRSLEQAYNLYLSLLHLIVVLTNAEDRRLDTLKQKYLPTQEELNPSMRFLNNRLADHLRTNQALNSFINSHGNIWINDDPALIRNLHQAILTSDIYKDYLASEDNYASDRDFWNKVLKNIIFKDEQLIEFVNDFYIYIDDELELIGTFVSKTLKRFTPDSESDQELLPMFKDEADKEFAIQLLHKTIIDRKENEVLINKQIENWELDRIALIDLFIMQIALAELQGFPSIPIQVTLNEYIDLGRYYSTPQSARFINGILDSIVKELKSNGLLFKS